MNNIMFESLYYCLSAIIPNHKTQMQLLILTFNLYKTIMYHL